MNFSMYQLARHPEIQEKARAEVLEKIAKHDGKFSYEALMEMEYLNQVFNGKLSQQSMTLDLKPNMRFRGNAYSCSSFSVNATSK